jgi:carboxyl-terminal processing protease
MHPVLRPLLVLAFSSACSVGALWWTGWPWANVTASLEAEAAGRMDYHLEQLTLVRETMRYVRDGYVDPSRVEPQRMFVAALESVEQMIPEVMFRRDGQSVAVRIGSWRSTVLVDPPTRVDEVADRLAPIAALLRQHLDPASIPNPDAHVDPFAMVEYAMANGALATLDPHSMVLPPSDAAELDVENRGEFGGLGINIEMKDGELVIEYAMPDTPAARAGLRDGDRVRRIDGEAVLNVSMDDAIELLRGPVGAPITLEIVRAGVPHPFEVTLRRANIQLAPVEAFSLGNGFGYARIRSFHSTAAADLRQEVAALVREEGPIKGLVLDLRDNPGGYLTQAIAVANLFLAEGEIVSTRGPRDASPRVEYADASMAEATCPLVVLVSATSASASEIVAGALRNNERAVIVGERTFGKGSVQNLHDLSWDSKLKITVAQYLTPGERSIQSVGVPADVALAPAIVPSGGPRSVALSQVNLFGRELVHRERDLDAHLDGSNTDAGEAAWRLRFLARPGALERREWEPPDARQDAELAVALSILAVAPAPRRPEMLAAASKVLRRERAEQDQQITEALGALGVDWTDGPEPALPLVDLTVDLGGDHVLTAGTTEPVTLTVTNRGAEPLHRLVAVGQDHELLEGAEFVLGYLGPGESRSVSVPVTVPDGYPAERAAVTLSLRGAEGDEIGRERVMIEAVSRPLPRLAWQWRLNDPTDGRIDVGDTVELVVDVANEGAGTARAASVRIRNGAGRALDIVSGTLLPGALRTTDGAPCLEDGLADCRPTLLPGERWTGTLTVRVLEALVSGYPLVLTAGDGEAFDYGAVVRSGFGDAFRQEEAISFELGSASMSVPPTPLRSPPQVEITLAPGLEATTDLVTLSGRVTDDSGLVRVMVYVGDDKVYFEGTDASHHVRSAPFSADAWLVPGRNTITVLATDDQGLTTATSRVVWMEPALLQAAIGPDR